MTNEEPKNLEDKFFDLLKNDKIQNLLSKLIDTSKWKMLGDIVIALMCIVTVMLAAKFKFIEQNQVSSLLSLIIGAIIGARFKNSQFDF